MGGEGPAAWSGGRAEEVWAAYYGAVATWVATLTGDQAAARQVTSEAYVRMFGHWGEEPDPEAWLHQRRTMHAIPRSGTLPEMAELVVYLASDLAAFVTGQAIAIDGGFSAR